MNEGEGEERVKQLKQDADFDSGTRRRRGHAGREAEVKVLQAER